MRVWLALLFALTASCRDAGVWSDFYGIEFQAPRGANRSSSGNSTPGPLGNEPIRPGVVLTLPKPKSIFVEIVKLPEPVSLDGMKFVLGQQASQVEGSTDPRGWRLSYVWRNDLGGNDKVHVVYWAMPDGQYQCQWDESSSKDLVAAESICRSIRPKGR